MRSAQEKLAQYNKIVNESLNIWEYCVESYQDHILTIHGDMDFTWGHKVELYFHYVSFMSISKGMTDLSLRFATENECKLLKKTLFYLPKCNEVFVFCKAEDDKLGRDYKYYIVAKDFNYKIAFTYNYLRAGLKDGENIEESVLHYYAEEIKLCDEIVRKYFEKQNKTYKDTTIRDLVYTIINHQERYSEKGLDEYANEFMKDKEYKTYLNDNL